MRNSNAPKVPQEKRLEELLNCSLLTGSESKEAQDTLSALEWLLTFLQNRRLYHRKQQLKNKFLVQKAKEYGLDNDELKHDVDAVLTNEVLEEE